MPDDLEATLSRLVQAADPDGDDALALARDELAEAGLDVADHPKAGALVARRGDPSLLLAGHVDVVPADAGDWPVDPGVSTRRDGAIWGRGAADMLGAVACFLSLAREAPDLPLGVVLTTDEETGMEGARRLVDDGALAGAEAVVLGEPTDLALGLAHKGVLWFDVHLEGATAHASMPGEGGNALPLLAEAVEALARLDLGVDHRLLGPATVVPTQAEAGEARNQVPGRARLAVDARFPPPLGPDDILAAVDEALDGLPHQVEVAFSIDPYETPADGRLARAAADALEAAGLPAEGVGLPFGTEAGRYRRAVDQQVVLGPGDPALAHTSRERVPVDDLAAARRVYRGLAEAWEGPDP